jgi:glycosyltransferase involved in cell wall biosynthesis
MGRKKMAMILSRFPYPLDKGDRLRAYHQLKFLSRHYDIYLYTLSDQVVTKEQEMAIKPYCAQIHIFQLRKREIYWYVVYAFLNRLPVQVGYFYSPRIKLLMQASVIALQPEVVYSQLSRTAFYAKDLPFRKVMDMQDAFSVNYDRIRQVSTGLTKYFYKRESEQMRHFETKMLSWFDRCTIISEFDKRAIASQPNQVVVVSNGVDTDYFKPQEVEKEVDICFCGNLSYLPNEQAVNYLFEQILPVIQTQRPHIRVRLAGVAGHKWLKYASDTVRIDDWVKDIREVYSSARIFVAPLFSGAGLQNKLLEAMSMGIPCVTTPVTNASLRATPETEVLLADDAQLFARQIIRLLEDDDLYQSISVHARCFVEATFNWEQVNMPLLKVLEAE